MQSFHPDDRPFDVAVILALLEKYLPYSLPLYRRIQFAHCTVPTRLIISEPVSTLAARAAGQAADLSTQWLVAYSDPDRGPETQIYLFASWEMPSPPASDDVARTATTHARTATAEPDISKLLLSLLTHIHDSDLYPPSAPSNAMHALIGSLHSTSARIIRSLGAMDLSTPTAIDPADGVMHLPETYNKWIFDRPVPAHATGADDRATLLPSGCAWGAVREADLALVRSRTTIPRQDRTLRLLPSAAIYEAGHESALEGAGAGTGGVGPMDGACAAPMAWVFLGVDGSLVSLHVEPEYRGRGLAKLLARRVWASGLGVYKRPRDEGAGRGENEGWAHADVAVDNAGSSGVCRSLGGRVMWQSYWMRVDLAKARARK